eukprot:Clim_evm21s155 gene=Clim_evmTU21s155
MADETSGFSKIRAGIYQLAVNNPGTWAIAWALRQISRPFTYTKDQAVTIGKEAAERAGEAAAVLQAITIRVIIALFLGSILLGTAFFNYLVVYYLLIPQVSHQYPIYFDYDHEGYDPPKPTAFLKIGDGYRTFSAYHIYDVTVALDMPETPSNRDYGNFMIVLTLYDDANNIVAISKRPAIIHYYSIPVRLSAMFSAMPAYITGFLDQRQLLQIQMMEGFQDYRTVTTAFSVSLSSQDIHTYSAMLSFDVRFSGIRYYMYWWPITSAIIGTSIIYVTLSMALWIGYLNISQNLEGDADDVYHMRDISPQLGTKTRMSGYDPHEYDRPGGSTSSPGVEDVFTSGRKQEDTSFLRQRAVKKEEDDDDDE